jgi:hypothetical protein
LSAFRQSLKIQCLLLISAGKLNDAAQISNNELKLLQNMISKLDLYLNDIDLIGNSPRVKNILKFFLDDFKIFIKEINNQKKIINHNIYSVSKTDIENLLFNNSLLEISSLLENNAAFCIHLKSMKKASTPSFSSAFQRLNKGEFFSKNKIDDIKLLSSLNLKNSNDIALNLSNDELEIKKFIMLQAKFYLTHTTKINYVKDIQNRGFI